MAKQRAVIYVRQSVTNEESISLELQETACRDYAARSGYAVIDPVIQDPGISGLQFAKRPGIRRAIELAEDGQVEVVLCWRWSRISRKRTDQAVIFDRIETAGARVESATEPVDTGTASGRLSRGMMLEFAAFESDQKSEQWKEAQARRLRNGLPTGGAARLGYVLVEEVVDDRKVRRPHPHPEYAPLIRQAYLDYIKGDGFQVIAMRLNHKNVKTSRKDGKPIGVHTLIRALDSGFAAGLLVQRKGGAVTYLPGKHEALISESEWDSYQTHRNKNRKVPTKARNPKWWLAGLVKCGKCDGPMAVNSHNAVKSQVVCLTYKNSRTCTGTWINRATVERRVGMWLGGRLDELARHGWDDKARGQERSKLERRLAKVNKSRADLERQLAKLSTGWAKDLLDDEAYRVGRTELDEERKVLDAELEAIHSELDELLPLDADVYETLTSMGKDMTTSAYNELVKRVIRRIVVGADTLTLTPVTGKSVVLPRRLPSDDEVWIIEPPDPN